MLAPLALAVLWMGVYPESFLAPMRKPISPRSTRALPEASA
jgi:NADH-quinone oxidoreductase subunit M